MARIEYAEKRDLGTSVKYDFAVYDADGEAVEENVLTLSDWQTDDGKFESRLRQLAAKRLPDDVEPGDVAVEEVG